MPKKNLPSKAIVALAKKLFADAQKSALVKQPRGLVAVGSRGGGSIHSVTTSNVDYRDYLVEAERMLRGN